MSEPKATVDAGSAGPLNAGKLISPLCASNVRLKTVNHYPIIPNLYSGAADSLDTKSPATVDTLGSTEGVLEGAGSGYEPPCYTECIKASTYAADVVGIEGCDLTMDTHVTNVESVNHSEESLRKF